MEKQLPKNWVETELGNYAYLKNGYAFKSSDFCNIGIPVIKISNIKDGQIDLDNSMCIDQSIAKAEFSVNKGDILIAMSGATTGKFGLYNLDDVAMQNQRVGNVKPLIDELSHKKFIYYLLFDLKQDIETMAYGGAQPNISPQLISSLRIPLPPLAEQERIAEKLDALFGQLDSVRGAMNRIPTLLANLRQQILTHAVTGKLTQEWREGKNLEKWEEKSLLDIAIPKSGYPFNASDFTDYGIQVIRMGNLYNNKLSLDRNPVFLPNDYDENIIKKSAVKKNDILLTLTGTKYKRDYGYAIKIEVDDAVLLLNQRILSLTSLINPNFLLIALRGDQFRDQFFSFETGGVNQGNVGVKNVMTIALDIPPVEEQTEIANRVQSLFEKLDSIEQRYQMLKTTLENLPQTILHKAFKGELVEQLPTDGNATDLLREIELLKKSLKKK